MNTYEATLAAADLIELQPLNYEFWNNEVPVHCNSCGCALGWIGFFLGVEPRTSSQHEVASRRLGIRPSEFYRTLDELTGSDRDSVRNWRESPRECAKALRLYAQKYLMLEAA